MPTGLRARVVEANFADLDDVVAAVTDEPVAGVLFDFGVSSHQLDEAGAGFLVSPSRPAGHENGPRLRLYRRRDRQPLGGRGPRPA